ncbi:hypothetical protein [Gordonia sp. FQ]|uniref:hypothetical protein n=1 Tax=Gordonia sp. FQ TaxID=3446634 RepID=UPI003F87A6C3
MRATTVLTGGAVAAVLMAGVTACSSSDDGGSGSGSAAQTTASVTVPADVTLTQPGTTLKIGETAWVPADVYTLNSAPIGITVTGIVAGNADDVNAAADGKVEASGEVVYVQFTVTNASDTPLPEGKPAGGLNLVGPDKKNITPKYVVPGTKNCDGKAETPAGIGKGQSFTSCLVVRGGSEFLGAGFSSGNEPYAPTYQGNPIIWKK